MNLLQIRTDFVKKNGRYDLVVDTTNYADNGANFYIQAGQRILDSILPNRKSIGRYTTDLASGQSSVIIKNTRFIDRVEMKKSGSVRTILDRKSYSWLRDQYGDDEGQQAVGTLTLTATPTTGVLQIGAESYSAQTISSLVLDININSSLATAEQYSATEVLITAKAVGTDTVSFVTTFDTGSVNGSGLLGADIAGRASAIAVGPPLYYAPISTAKHPDVTLANLGSVDTMDILLGVDRFAKDGIKIMPPSDDTYTLTIFANFFSVLTDDLDVSYHSEMYPDLLIMAANLSIEMFYRNTSGVQDWRNSMQVILDGIDKDAVFSEMRNAGNQLKG